MSNYRRADVTGASYFFTVVTHQRIPVFSNDTTVQILREAMRDEMQRRPFVIDAAVVLPDHLHCIWRLPHKDADFSSRWREIKKTVSKGISAAENSKIKVEVWQRRFWEHLIRNERDWRTHMDYIHYNPVKHGYVATPPEWRWSTFSHWVDKGAYESSWGSSEPSDISQLDFE